MAAPSKAPSAPVVMMAESSNMRQYPWRQYYVISDRRMVIVEMEQAVLDGWRYKSAKVQGEDCWPGMDRDTIIAYKQTSAYPLSECTLTPADLETVLAIARIGYVKRCAKCVDVLTEPLLGQLEPERCRRCP